jgi:hypothetical protein
MTVTDSMTFVQENMRAAAEDHSLSLLHRKLK